MADLNQSISNSIRMIAAGPSFKWGSELWNNFIWGGDGNMTHRVQKFISNSQSISDSLFKTPKLYISTSVTPTLLTTSEMVGDGSGYFRVFVSGVTEAEDRSFSAYTEQSNSTTWTEQTDSQPTWTEDTDP